MKFKAYLSPSKPDHGPQQWSKYRFFSLSIITLTTYVYKQVHGYRLWVYSRWGAIHFDLILKRDKS